MLSTTDLGSSGCPCWQDLVGWIHFGVIGRQLACESHEATRRNLGKVLKREKRGKPSSEDLPQGDGQLAGVASRKRFFHLACRHFSCPSQATPTLIVGAPACTREKRASREGIRMCGVIRPTSWRWTPGHSTSHSLTHICSWGHQKHAHRCGRRRR